MLHVRRSDIRKLYARFRRHSSGFGWKTELSGVDWKCLLKNLERAGPPRGALPVEGILDACGLEDALWAMGAVKGYRNAMRLFACRCAGKALAPVERLHPERVALLRGYLDIAQRHAGGHAGKEELTEARNRVWNILNPDPDLCVVDEEGASFGGKCSVENMHEHLRADPKLENAMVAVLSALREDSGDKAWKAAEYAVGVVSSQVGDALKECCVTEAADLERAAGAVADAVRDAVETLAGEVGTALTAVTGRAPDRNALRDGTLAAVRGAVGGKPYGNSGDSPEKLFRLFNREVKEEVVVKAVRADLAVECRKLCRLEGEYGEVGEA
jgi:hypothetical protein